MIWFHDVLTVTVFWIQKLVTTKWNLVFIEHFMIAPYKHEHIFRVYQTFRWGFNVKSHKSCHFKQLKHFSLLCLMKSAVSGCLVPWWMTFKLMLGWFFCGVGGNVPDRFNSADLWNNSCIRCLTFRTQICWEIMMKQKSILMILVLPFTVNMCFFKMVLQ